jgi:hypothetical protein
MSDKVQTIPLSIHSMGLGRSGSKIPLLSVGLYVQRKQGGLVPIHPSVYLSRWSCT